MSPQTLIYLACLAAAFVPVLLAGVVFAQLEAQL